VFVYSSISFRFITASPSYHFYQLGLNLNTLV